MALCDIDPLIAKFNEDDQTDLRAFNLEIRRRYPVLSHLDIVTNLGAFIQKRATQKELDCDDCGDILTVLMLGMGRLERTSQIQQSHWHLLYQAFWVDESQPRKRPISLQMLCCICLGFMGQSLYQDKLDREIIRRVDTEPRYTNTTLIWTLIHQHTESPIFFRDEQSPLYRLAKTCRPPARDIFTKSFGDVAWELFRDQTAFVLDVLGISCASIGYYLLNQCDVSVQTDMKRFRELQDYFHQFEKGEEQRLASEATAILFVSLKSCQDLPVIERRRRHNWERNCSNLLHLWQEIGIIDQCNGDVAECVRKARSFFASKDRYAALLKG